VQFFVRTQGDPLIYLHSIRAAIASVASDQQISNAGFNGGFNSTFILNEAIEHDPQYSRQRLFSTLFGVFSAMAFAVVLVGIFSALLACLWPARHAIAVSPAEALRCE